MVVPDFIWRLHNKTIINKIHKIYEQCEFILSKITLKLGRINSPLHFKILLRELDFIKVVKINYHLVGLQDLKIPSMVLFYSSQTYLC